MSHSFQSVQRKLIENLNSQRLTGTFCDIILNIGNATASFPIHSCVLASYSPGMFQGDEMKNLLGSCSFNHPLKLTVVHSVNENDFVNCSACVLRVIEFMYLGKIQIPREHINHVEALSSCLEIADLVLICQNFLCNNGDESSSIPRPRLVGDSYSNVEITNSNRLPTLNKSPPSNDCNLPSEESPVSSVLQSQINCPVPGMPNNDLHACSRCKLTFSNSAQLRQHRETHLGKLYSCFSCKYSSQKAIELMKHLIEANHNEIVCSLCMYEGENPGILKQHIELHNHPKPFFCAICNLRFPTRTGLNFHAPKHSTETPFRCSVCNRGFKWKQNLISHLVVHTTVKKHLCDQCGFSTAHKSTFNAHELSHTGLAFKCTQAECKFEAVSKRNLIVHLATHTKEKPYQCEVCGQSFSQLKNLRRHAVIHDAMVDFYHCPMCVFKSIRYDKLKEHFKKRHSNCDEKLLPLRKKNILIPVVVHSGLE